MHALTREVLGAGDTQSRTRDSLLAPGSEGVPFATLSSVAGIINRDTVCDFRRAGGTLFPIEGFCSFFSGFSVKSPLNYVFTGLFTAEVTNSSAHWGQVS